MKTGRITVHMIGHAHLDPVWLWPWQAGLDEVLGTCRTACNLLDKYPDFINTRGEAWCYAQVEQLDPPLFRRIQAHVAAGRWEIVNGWWVQPDCNLPSGWGMERQIELGKRYFQERFGLFPEVGYNVDTFGHAATLPGYMRAAGQRYYVMMRPGEQEKKLPARLFRWRGYANGPEVTVFRIAGAYGGTPQALAENFRLALTELPPGVEHTMFFYGVGDHGGGPTEELIQWIQANRDTYEGCELIFSSCARFFGAIADQVKTLPLVTDELQYHAIGCYSVQRNIKTAVRRAEHALRQVEIVSESEPAPKPEIADELKLAWERVCFNQFHDTLGGTILPSAYPQQLAQVDAASCFADDFLQYYLRRRYPQLPDDPRQRMVLYNASDQPFEGYTEGEPWTRRQAWQPQWRLVDERGRRVPYQEIRAEGQIWDLARVLFRVKLAPGELRVVHIETEGKPAKLPPPVEAKRTRLANRLGVGLNLKRARGLELPGLPPMPLPRLEMIDDFSDNWTHEVDRYADGPVTGAEWEAPVLLESGALRGALWVTGRLGQSQLEATWRVYADEPCLELLLKVHWCEKWKLLKLTLPLSFTATSRVEGIMGGSLKRKHDGCERPLRDWTLLTGKEGARLGIVCPDIYALDATPQRVRLTLLRSPELTQHDPQPRDLPAVTFADQGVHEFRLRFYGSAAKPELLERQGMMLQRPLLFGELTRGMPAHGPKG